MGTRYHLTVTCPFCEAKNEDVYFAPTSGIGSHSCVECKEQFWIGDDFQGYVVPPLIDMRKHSTWGNNFTEKTGAPAMQILGNENNQS